MMKCPGQDTRYWKPEDVCELACAQCGRMVEFFKTDGRRQCPGCGSRIENPNVSLGCAQWCEHAVECLGYDPKTVRLKPSADTSVVKELTDAVRAALHGDAKRIDRALAVLAHARTIMTTEGGRPRVVIAAALLFDLDVDEARRVLKDRGVDAVTAAHVVDIVASGCGSDGVDTLESRIVGDAARLADLVDATDVKASGRFRTESGKARAAELLSQRNSHNAKELRG